MPNLRQSFRSVRQRIERAAQAAIGSEQGALAIERYGRIDVAFRKGTTDERVIAHSFDNDIFYSAMPDYVSAADHVILDVGAHIGTFSLLSATRVPNGRVWAIEASQDSFNYLRINAAINRFHNLQVSHLALSDKSGHARLFHDAAGNWGHSIMAPLSNRSEEVETQSLETFMAANRIDRVNLAKFNCEGAEFPILLGASKQILARFDRLLILFHCDLARGYTLGSLTSALESAGFMLTVDENIKQRGRILARR